MFKCIKILIISAVLLFVSSELVFAEGFSLSSPDINGQLSLKQVFSGFGCTGANISPKLSWKNAPKGTKSFAVTIYDPDAPTGSGWWHWQIFDIPKNVKSLKRNAGLLTTKKGLAPKGSVQTKNDYGKFGFGGACPPKGDSPHRYIVTVYALNVEKLGVDNKTSAPVVGFYLNSNTLARASLIAYYGRK